MEGRWTRLVRPRLLLVAMAVAYGVVIGGAALFFSQIDRHETLVRAQAAADDLAGLIAGHASRTLGLADQILLRIADCDGAGKCDLAAMLARAPALANLYVLDSAGRVVMDARSAHRPGTDFSARHWLGPVAPAGAPVIGGTVFDEASRSAVFSLARRLDNGTYAVATMDADGFRRLYQGLDMGRAPSLALIRPDGLVLVRPSRPGDAPIVESTHEVEGFPVMAWAGFGADEALAEWRVRSSRLGLLVLAGLAVSMALAWVLTRGWSVDRGAARALTTLNRDLERSNADLEQFAYIASHDLKEPLRNISSYVQLLQRRYQGKLDPDADAFIGYTVDGVRRMQAIINELLAYSRVGTGKLDLAPSSAGAAIASALGQLKTVISEAQAAVEIKGPMPVVPADPAQLASLFQNLIGNAVKYRSPDTRPEITVTVGDLGREWRFSIADNGIGIEPQYHGQIFDLFKRLHPRGNYAGTGIGLALCKRVVERHGGQIGVTSEPGRGSTFWFTLPKITEATHAVAGR